MYKDLKKNFNRSFNQIKSITSIISCLHSTGQIEDEDYEKYLLDETGTYLPKIKKQ